MATCPGRLIRTTSKPMRSRRAEARMDVSSQSPPSWTRVSMGYLGYSSKPVVTSSEV